MYLKKTSNSSFIALRGMKEKIFTSLSFMIRKHFKDDKKLRGEKYNILFMTLRSFTTLDNESGIFCKVQNGVNILVNDSSFLHHVAFISLSYLENSLGITKHF